MPSYRQPRRLVKVVASIPLVLVAAALLAGVVRAAELPHTSAATAQSAPGARR
jgi:hypothetical protein